MPPIERDEKKLVYKRGKRRVAAKQPSPARCLEWLRGSNLHGVLCRNAVWLACTRQLAYFLERVCLGRRAQAEAAAGVPVFANAPAPAPAPAPTPRHARGGAPVARGGVLHGAPDGLPHRARRRARRAARGGRLGPRRAPAGERGWRRRRGLADAARGRSCGARSRGSAPSVPRRQNPWRRLHREVRRARALRNQGWLPRSGLQYGADFVLYRNHPSLVHSDFCVVPRRTPAPARPGRGSGRGETAPTAPRARLGIRKWTEVQAASRLCVQVNKGLISAPVTSEPADASTPACLRSIAVEETEVRRFNPERNKPERDRASGVVRYATIRTRSQSVTRYRFFRAAATKRSATDARATRGSSRAKYSAMAATSRTTFHCARHSSLLLAKKPRPVAGTAW